MNFLQNYRQKFQGTWQHTLRVRIIVIFKAAKIWVSVRIILHINLRKVVWRQTWASSSSPMRYHSDSCLLSAKPVLILKNRQFEPFKRTCLCVVFSSLSMSVHLHWFKCEKVTKTDPDVCFPNLSSHSLPIHELDSRVCYTSCNTTR